MTNGGHPKPKKTESQKKKAAKKAAPKSASRAWVNEAVNGKKPAAV